MWTINPLCLLVVQFYTVLWYFLLNLPKYNLNLIFIIITKYIVHQIKLIVLRIRSFIFRFLYNFIIINLIILLGYEWYLLIKICFIFNFYVRTLNLFIFVLNYCICKFYFAFFRNIYEYLLNFYIDHLMFNYFNLIENG